jgi:ribose transport system substrate-binding protein
MNRREVLKYTAAGVVGLGSTLKMLEAQAFASDASPNACYAPFTPTTKPFAWPQKAGPYRLAVLNSFVGNDWRSEMVKVAKAYVARPDVHAQLKSFRITSSGNDISAQIAQFNQFILSGVDIIVTDAASPTGLNSVIQDAADAGVLVVSFDNVVTSDKAVLVNHDQTEMGRIWARFIVQQTGGKGKVLMNRGVAGTFGDEVFTKGGMEIFSQHPGIELIQVNGNWDQGTSQKVTSDALADGHKFDGVWSEYGDTGVVRAFLQNGATVPPIAGQSENGFRKLAAAHKFPILSAGVSPGLVAASIKTAFAILGGEKVPQSVRIPLDAVTTAELRPGINYFPDLPDSFIAGFNIPQCGLQFTVNEILAQTS